MAKSLYLLDGHYQIYRAFFAPFRELTSPSGEPTRATFVFTQMIFQLLRTREPDYFAMVMDVSDETTFRRDLDHDYKAHRDPTPEALSRQADRIVSMLEAIRLPIYRVPGFEADDIMATIAERLRDEDMEVYLASRDKDLEQLISDKVRLYDAANEEVIDEARLREKKGYSPREAVEIQTLMGDSTDNIPGVEGVGPKTAIKLIQEYGSAKAVLDNAEKLSGKLVERVKAFAPKFDLTRQLVTLRRDTPVKFDLEDCNTVKLNLPALRPIFDELGFTRLKDQLDSLLAERGPHKNAEPPVATASAARDLLSAAVEKVTYHLIDTVERLADFAKQLKKQRRFAFDTETTGINPVSADAVGLSFSWKAGEAWYLPVRAGLARPLPVEMVVKHLRPIFEDETVGKVGQNIKYDSLVLRQLGIVVGGVMFDTRIASFLLDPLGRSHSLDSLAKRWFNHDMIPITDLIGKGKNQITMDEVDVQRVCEYSCEDADYTWRTFEVLEPKIKGSHVEPLFRDTEIPLIEVLTEMENNGIALNKDHLARLGKTITERMGDLDREIIKAAGRSFNLDSTQQLAQVLFDEQKLPVVKRTKTGRSTDHETLESLVAITDNPIPRLILEYRELAKLKSTYVDTLPKMVNPRTGRIHASFDQTGAVTGRLASRDPNLQNIPVRTEMGRKIRHAFVAGDSEHLLLTLDYSQIELRLLAHFSRDAALLSAFLGGQDIHRAVAAEVHGVPPDQVTPEQRSAAKAVNFGIIYGQTPFGLARALGISQSDAKAFIDRYFDRYPGIRSFIENCIQTARRKGYVETILGRRRPVEELQSRSRQQVAFGERIAVNTVVQGSAADLIKRAMIDVHRAFKERKHQGRLLVQVHDELVFEIRRSDVEQTADSIRKSMEGAIALEVPVVVDVAWGNNWAEAK